MSIKRNAPKALPHLHDARMALVDALLADEDHATAAAVSAVDEATDAFNRFLVTLAGMDDKPVALCSEIYAALPEDIREAARSLEQSLEAANDDTLTFSDFTSETEDAAESMDELFEALRALTPLFPKAEARMDIAEATP